MSLLSDDFVAQIAPAPTPPAPSAGALLASVLTTLPAPQAAAAAAADDPRRARIAEAIAAYAPTTGLQALFVTQLLSVRLLAEDTARQAAAPELPEQQAQTQRRLVARLTRLAGQLERTLRRMRRQATTPGKAPAAAGFALPAANLVWLFDPDRPAATRRGPGEATAAATAAAPGATILAFPRLRPGGAVARPATDGQLPTGPAA